MTTFLFWNINRKPLSELVARLAEEHGIDVIILAQSQIEPARLLTGLNENGLAQFHYAPTPGGSTVSVFTRFSARFLRRQASLLGANGCPDREIGSDHLPIVFSLDLEGVGE